MSDEKKNVSQKQPEIKEGFIKKSFQYPEASQDQPRPLGAEVSQPQAKTTKKTE